MTAPAAARVHTEEACSSTPHSSRQQTGGVAFSTWSCQAVQCSRVGPDMVKALLQHLRLNSSRVCGNIIFRVRPTNVTTPTQLRAPTLHTHPDGRVVVDDTSWHDCRATADCHPVADDHICWVLVDVKDSRRRQHTGWARGTWQSHNKLLFACCGADHAHSVCMCVCVCATPTHKRCVVCVLCPKSNLWASLPESG